MYILKNALKNLWRNKGRNFIVFLIVLLTLTSVTLSSAIGALSKQSIWRYKDSFHVDAEIDFDWEKLEKDFPPKETVNEDGSITQESSFDVSAENLGDYLKYADSQYVRRTKYSVYTQFASDGLSKVPDNLNEDESFVDLNGMSIDELKKFFNVDTEAEVAEQLGGEDALWQVLDMKSNCVGTLQGYTDLSLVEEFSSGENKLKTGSFPEKMNECIVSSKYAEHNHLEIGDTIEISGASKSDTDTVSLTITGIYTASRNEASAVPLGDAYGYVYTTFDTIMNSGFHWIEVDKVVFELKDPDSARLFEEELHEKGLSRYKFLSCGDSSDEYVKNTEPLKRISHIADIFTLCAGMVGAAIILLISCISIRERKYEIGVLRAIGMKKSSVARGMLYETLMIMAVGVGISMPVCAVLTKPIALSLIGDLKGVSTALSPAAVWLNVGIAFILSVISGLCSVLAVMRHEPMKILSERN